MRTLASAVSRRSSSGAGRPTDSVQTLVSPAPRIIQAGDPDLDLVAHDRNGGLECRAVMTLPTPQPIAGFRKDRDAGAKAGFIDEGHGPLRVATPSGVRCEIEVHAAPLDPSEKLGSPDRASLDKVLVQELFERSSLSHACVWWR